MVIGLTLGGRLARRPGVARALRAVHEQAALAALIAIAVHALTLLGDRWLAPGPAGIAIPFVRAILVTTALAVAMLSGARLAGGPRVPAAAPTPERAA